MAVTSSAPTNPPERRVRQRLLWSRLHFALRLLGLTGALLACGSGVLAAIEGRLKPLSNAVNASDAYHSGVNLASTALKAPQGNEPTVLLLAGAALALLALLVEVVVMLGFSASRRSAFGMNALVQGVLAALLLVGVNVWSFSHYQRVDFTRDHRFTLPAEVRADLAQLDPKSKTTVIVYQMHKTFGLRPDKVAQDEIESAAERKVIEKVKELADQLREAGSRHLTIEVLDRQVRGYKDRLEQLTKDAPDLRKAIERAPENSLFFYVQNDKGKTSVQRLSFNDFYLLDKTASQEDRGGRGNLVLLYQGMEPFARRLTHLEGKRPRIGIAVLDSHFASTSDLFYGLKGLRLALEKRGFEVQDVVLKKWSSDAPPAADAATVDETLLERLNGKLTVADKFIAAIKRERERMAKSLEIWKKAVNDAKTREQLTRELADQLDGAKLTVEDARLNAAALKDNLEYLDMEAIKYGQRKKDLEAEKSKLNEPALRDRQRMTDVKAKMARWLADCDLLIVPRLTLWDLGSRLRLSPSVHKLDDPQVEAIQDFLKTGKPVLACFGPSTLLPEDRGRSLTPADEKPDKLEQLFAELGVKFGKETVLFDDEVDALADARSGSGLGGEQFEAPPVRFDWRPGEGRPAGAARPPDKPNPIRESMRLTARALGKDDDGRPLPLDIRIRHPRPIYFVPPKGSKPAFDAEFLMTSPRGWNEDQLPARDALPQFEKPKTRDREAKPSESSKDPLATRRHGSFPIGVAFETAIPDNWHINTPVRINSVRLAVIGQGGFFTGKELPPAQEKLFVNTINWLLGRDDQLPRAERVWSYPRVNDTIPPDSPTEYLWLWGVRLGLPVLFAFFGFVVLLFRRLR